MLRSSNSPPDGSKIVRVSDYQYYRLESDSILPGRSCWCSSSSNMGSLTNRDRVLGSLKSNQPLFSLGNDQGEGSKSTPDISSLPTLGSPAAALPTKDKVLVDGIRTQVISAEPRGALRPRNIDGQLELVKDAGFLHSTPGSWARLSKNMLPFRARAYLWQLGTSWVHGVLPLVGRYCA